MGCSNKLNTCYQKSCQRYYNPNAQAFTAGEALTLQIAGNRVADTGISIETEATAFNVSKSGLYHISADAIVSANTAGTATLTVYRDGVALPCTVRTVTVPVGFAEIHTETDIVVNCCCAGGHAFTFVLTPAAADGNVTQFCAGMVKLA